MTSSFFSQPGKGDFVQIAYDCAPAELRSSFERENQLMLEITRGFSSLLEVGCGSGRILQLLSQPFRVGLDIALGNLCAAKKTGAALVRGDALRMPFRSGSLPLVLCVQNSLGNMGDDWHAVVREMGRVARKNGRIVISVFSHGAHALRVQWYATLHEAGVFGAIDWSRTTSQKFVNEQGWSSRTFEKIELREVLEPLGAATIREEMGLFWFCSVDVTNMNANERG